MQRETEYRFEYRGSQIRCVRVVEEYQDEDDLIGDILAWFLVAVGAIVCYGWWLLWA